MVRKTQTRSLSQSVQTSDEVSSLRYWFPQMQSSEMVIFKSWDETEATGDAGPILSRLGADPSRSKLVLHTGFVDSKSAADAPARESLEIRVLLFWPPEEDEEGEEGGDSKARL